MTLDGIRIVKKGEGKGRPRKDKIVPDIRISQKATAKDPRWITIKFSAAAAKKMGLGDHLLFGATPEGLYIIISNPTYGVKITHNGDGTHSIQARETTFEPEIPRGTLRGEYNLEFDEAHGIYYIPTETQIAIN